MGRYWSEETLEQQGKGQRAEGTGFKVGQTQAFTSTSPVTIRKLQDISWAQFATLSNGSNSTPFVTLLFGLNGVPLVKSLECSRC